MIVDIVEIKSDEKAGGAVNKIESGSEHNLPFGCEKLGCENKTNHNTSTIHGARNEIHCNSHLN
jgi:hypothetical protein